MSLFELRTYNVHPHNRRHLYARFRDATSGIFERLGFDVVGYWTVAAGPGEGDLVYLLRWSSGTEREDGWRRFADDPEWQHVVTSTNEAHGPMVAATHSTLLRPTDFSPMR
jgi:hypothetical protein